MGGRSSFGSEWEGVGSVWGSDSMLAGCAGVGRVCGSDSTFDGWAGVGTVCGSDSIDFCTNDS